MKFKNKTIGFTSLRYTLLVALIPLTIASLLYFNITQSTANETTHEQTREISKQIVLNFENYINNLIDTSDYIVSQIDEFDVKNDHSELHYNFELATELQKDIESIALYDQTGLLILDDLESKQRMVHSKPWFQQAMNNKNVNHFSSVDSDNDLLNTQVISLSRYVTYFSEGIEKKGVLRIDINFDGIKELINITRLGEYGAVMFIDEYDQIVYSSTEQEDYYDMDEIKSKVIGEFNTQINDQSMFVNINTIAHTRWRIITYLNRNYLIDIRNSSIGYFILILLTAIVLAIVFAFRFSRRLTQPIEKLKTTLLTVEPRNLAFEVNEDDYDEIKVLNESINKMSHRINNLMQSVIKEQEEKAELELDILQHQINPHFLYNTLDTIVVLSENDRKDDVVSTIIALSRYFRINLSGGSKYITVQEEFEQIKNYLKIQKARYQTRFEYEITINENIMNYEILKLIVQPLVENAIYHGTSIYEDSLISIYNEVIDDFYYIRVVNSGYGLTDEQVVHIHQIMKEKAEGKSVGLRNVYSRLKLDYGQEADLFFVIDEDNNTIVSIKIPLSELKEIK